MLARTPPDHEITLAHVRACCLVSCIWSQVFVHSFLGYGLMAGRKAVFNVGDKMVRDCPCAIHVSIFDVVWDTSTADEWPAAIYPSAPIPCHSLRAGRLSRYRPVTHAVSALQNAGEGASACVPPGVAAKFTYGDDSFKVNGIDTCVPTLQHMQPSLWRTCV